MYKNKTLKSLAISAVVALGFSGLAVTSASADYGLADKTFVVIDPAVGDEWTVLADGEFVVEANKAALTGDLSLLVEDAAAAATSSDVVVTRATDKSFVLNSSTAVASTSASAKWTISPSASARDAFSSSVTVKVTAWNDANNNGKIDSTEYASTTQTITFLDADDVKMNLTLNRPIVGDTELSALVSTTPTLNHEMGASLSDEVVADVVFQVAGISTTNSSTAINGWAWDEDDRNYTVTSSPLADWTFTHLEATASATVSSTVLGTVVYETPAAHNARVGDSFTATNSFALNFRATVSKIVSSTKFEATTLTTSPAITFSATVSSISAVANALDKVNAGTYVAYGYWNAVKVATSEFATAAVVADAVELNIAGSDSVQPIVNASAATSSIKAGTKTVDVVATVLDEDEKPVPAGRVVKISNNMSTGADFKVNGKTGTDTVLTDANGQVKATVTSVLGAKDTQLTLTFTAEGSPSAETTLKWVAQSFSLIDLSVANSAIASTRSIVAGSSYTMDLAVVDQWFAAPASADTYRLTVTGAGAANGIVTLSAGKGSVTIGDNGLDTSYATTITLQKLGTDGKYAAASSVVVNTFVATGAVTMGADATSLYGATVDLSSAVAAKGLVEGDVRVAPVTVPAYGENAVVAGVVRNATTGVAVKGAVVTVTGATSLLFSNDTVYKRGSITVVADDNGQFSVDVYSTTAAKDVVVTATALGNSATSKVTFTGVGVGEGTSLVITAPEYVAPASTLQIKAKLADAFGNSVEATEGRIKMTYTGAGIGFGTLPTSTDKNGELSYSVLLGAGDTGTITVVVSYDQNGDGDFVDAKDLNVTKTITVGAAAPVASSDAKVNAGSFKGYVALYAKGYEGQKMTAKVAGKWLKVDSLASGFERVVRYTGAGYDIIVEIYIDGELEGTFNLTTK